MARHTHQFVEDYTGLVGYGLDRETDESTLIYYLQKFSDDAVMSALIKRLDDGELAELFDGINRLMRRHFTEAEYHRLFLKDEGHAEER
jgi:hypothetical protein